MTKYPSIGRVWDEEQWTFGAVRIGLDLNDILEGEDVLTI